MGGLPAPMVYKGGNRRRCIDMQMFATVIGSSPLFFSTLLNLG